MCPPRGKTPQYYSKGDSERSTNLDGVVWQSEDPEGFKNDYCFGMRIHQYNNEVKGETLEEDEEFISTVKKIGYWLKYEYIPASLLIGKKTGDTLKLKDGSIVNLTCIGFSFLHHHLQLARESLPSESDPAKQAVLSKRLDEIEKLVTQHYGERIIKLSKEEEKIILAPDFPLPETSYCDSLLSCIKKVMLAIATFFVRLFTCNWDSDKNEIIRHEF